MLSLYPGIFWVQELRLADDMDKARPIATGMDVNLAVFAGQDS